jgi:D-alanyl-D-alanine carboxypeptidase
MMRVPKADVVASATYGKFLLARLTLLLLAALFVAPRAEAVSLASVPRYAAILVDADSGEVLYAHNPDEARHPASITKVMTLYLAFEALDSKQLKLSDRLYFSANAAAQPPSKLGIPRGQSISVEQAIGALTTKSANDVAVALAERLGGSEVVFARAMTEKAKELGMRSTAFYNASGLPNAAHHTTARDLATLSKALIRNFPEYYAYFKEQQFAFGGRVMPSHNKLLGKVVGLDGIKTGFTNASGYTLAASAARDGKRLIAVVLGAPSSASRNANIEALIEAGFTVLKKRKLGEELTVAASMMELPQGLDLGQAISEQGSSDDVSVWRSAIRSDKGAAATASPN